MRSLARQFVISSVALAALAVLPRCAEAQEGDEYDGNAVRQNRGLKVGLGPTLVVPLHDNGPYGFGVNVDVRYGIQVGPTVVAPGGRVAGYYISGRGVGVAMPTARITLPIGPLAPYILGGAGVGGLTSDTEGGAALMGGGGLMIHVSNVVAFGAEATYQAITGTELHTWTITPAIAFGG